jgi:3-deoxy-D-arabino-heptulosonate 7-phosphate (DAHP) synthase
VEYLSSKNIPVEVEITEAKSEGSFVKSLLKYSAAVEADMICIMNFYESSIRYVFNSSYEQQVITNDAQIPVLCVNPVDTYIADRSSLAS